MSNQFDNGLVRLALQGWPHILQAVQNSHENAAAILIQGRWRGFSARKNSRRLLYLEKCRRQAGAVIIIQVATALRI